jgi:hypothetical protein
LKNARERIDVIAVELTYKDGQVINIVVEPMVLAIAPTLAVATTIGGDGRSLLSQQRHHA